MRNPHQIAGRDDYLQYYAENCIFMIRGQVLGNCQSYSVDTSHQYENIVYINNVAYQATSTGITSCTVKEGTVSIAGSAFQYCSGLTSVDIPDSVTSIGYEAFDSCSSLTTINYKGTVDQWKTIKRESMWNYNVPSTTKVTCSDGDCGLDDK